MAIPDNIAAQMLREGRHAIAELVCSDHNFSAAGSGSRTRPETLDENIKQTEIHLNILAACIGFSSPAIWNDYVRWISNLPKAVSPIQHDFSIFIKTLSSVVEMQLPCDISKIIDTYLDTAVNSLRNETSEATVTLASNPHERLQREYLACLLATRRDEALRIVLDAVDLGIGIESIYLNVIQPTQHELGRRWQVGEICVAQEHYCTAATQFVMSQLQPYFLTDNSSGKTLVAICVGDELHEIGLRIVADLFEVNGWNSIYLGANSPTESIAQTIVSSGAQVLAISTTMTQHLFGLAEVIRVVRSHPGCENVKMVVGGYPFNVDPFLWKRIGADAYAIDAKQAVRVANELVGFEGPTADNTQLASVPRSFDERTEPGLNATHDDLSRLNNNLITLQRKLHKANVELAALNKANHEKAEALERANRRKDEFLAMLAHELRGPLAPMKLAVGLMQMRDLEPTVLAEASQTMKRQLQQMEHLISDLLDASRIAHGKIELKIDTIDLADVIHRAIEIVHPIVQDKQQELLLDLPASPIVLEGDEIRLAQIIANLLTNAAKYTEREGSIWLSVKRVRDAAVIEVRDNGVGMESESLPDVFSSFTQEQRSRQHSMGGLGLGLSLVKQLVELHRGSVKAESEGAGLGSVFSVMLPCLENDKAIESVEANPTRELKEPSPPRRVLIVEDTAGIARLTAILFEKLGHLPMIASDGRSAINKYAEVRPDIVVLDLELPDMSGLEVTREIRRLDPHDATLIVALTGHGDDEHRWLAKESGCDHYLVKPVDIRELRKLGTHPKLVTTNSTH